MAPPDTHKNQISQILLIKTVFEVCFLTFYLNIRSDTLIDVLIQPDWIMPLPSKPEMNVQTYNNMGTDNMDMLASPDLDTLPAGNLK